MKRSIIGLFGSGLASVLCASMASAAEPSPVLDFDFSKSAGGAVKDSASSGLTLKLGEDATVKDGALVLNPSGDSFAAADQNAFRAWAKKLDVSEMASSFWIRFDDGVFSAARNSDTASLGLFNCFLNKDGNICVKIFSKKTELLKPITMKGKFKAEFGKWYHVEFSYSMNARRYALYIDGKFQMENNNVLLPEPAIGDLKLGNGFRGAVRDLKFYDAALDSEELSLANATAEDYDALKKQADALAAGTKNAHLKAYAAELGKRALTYKKQIGKVTTAAHKRLVNALANATKVSDGMNKNKAITDKVLTTFVTPSTTNALYLPYAYPENGSVSNQIELIAAQDEFETASVIVFPFKPVKSFTMKMSDLTNGKNVIKKENADIKVVKRWYRAGGAWMSYHVDLYMRTLTPDMMLYDDSLVQVDEFRRTNKVRLEYADGAHYADVSKFSYNRTWMTNGFMHTFKDAKTLQPTTLREAGRNKQYLITYKVPKGTAPGFYTGKLELIADGKNAGFVDVTIKVLPFELPEPRTYEDTNEIFMSHVNSFDGREASLKYAMDHNMMHLSGVARTPDRLRIAKKLGYQMDIIYESPNMRGHGWEFGAPDSKRTPEYDAQMERMALAPFLRLEKMIDSFFGKNRDYILYRCQTSESGWYPRISNGPDQLSRVLREKTKTQLFSHGMSNALPFFTPGIYEMNSSSNRKREDADIWHSFGGKAITYAFPFPGPESPGLMRRTLGLELYKHDRFDGHMMHGFIGTNLNEFTKYPGGDGDYRLFDMAMASADGVIECLPSVGYREAFDDVRYASMMKMQAEDVLKNNKDELCRKEAKRQLAWLSRVDGKLTDMEAFRIGAQYRIVALMNLIKERKGK